MLLPVDHLIDVPIMSLQTGTELARTTGAIIDPRNMKIVAFYVAGQQLEDTPSVLHPSDIRELSDIGMIVDNSERIMGTEGLVRLQAVIDLNFQLVGKKVIDEQGNKLGKVMDYIVEPDDFTIQQLNIQQSILQSLGTATSVIRRTQIVAVREKVIVVKSPTIRSEADAPQQTSPQPFVNPFRGSQPESTTRQSVR